VIPSDDARVVRLTGLVEAGDVDGLRALLAEHPGLAADRYGDDAMSRTALHVVTDWPGGRPRCAEVIALLVAAGAPVDGRFAGPHRETALHWAASSDDVAAIDALLDAGADLEADGAVLTGGTPLADAVVFAQRAAGRRLVERGAAMTLWQAAALGEAAEVDRLLGASAYDAAALDNACWHACRAGEAAVVRRLVDLGADLDWPGYDGLSSREAALASGDAGLREWLGEWLGE
jgi:ankyrin repeat protein